MIRVFRDVGFETSRRSLSGVVSVEMSTEASSNAIAAADLRESVSEAHSLAPLLYPETVAVVGVRREGAGLGHAVLASILKGGFRGRVFVVHPEVPSIDGVAAFPRLADVPEHIDLAIIAVPAIHVLGRSRTLPKPGPPRLSSVSSGLGELGPERDRDPVRQMAFAWPAGTSIDLSGPDAWVSCPRTPVISLDATFSLSDPAARLAWPSPPSRGGSGGSRSLTWRGSSGWVSTRSSPWATRPTSRAMTFWPRGIDDPQVTAAALYLESFGNATKFARLGRRFAERKPLLAVVGGRSAGGQRAGASHTAAAASPAVGVDALLAQAGVIACRSAEAMGRTALLLSEQPLPTGRTSPSSATLVAWVSSLLMLRSCGARRPGTAGRASGPTRPARIRNDRHQQSDRPRCRRSLIADRRQQA